MAGNKPFDPVAEERELDRQLKQQDTHKKTLYQRYLAEEKVPVTISPMYVGYFGINMPVIINGISMYVPVNGSTNLLPKTFASECNRRIKAVDRSISKAAERAKIENNGEQSPGALELF